MIRGSFMHSFLVGLQFLTRIHIVSQTEWTAEDFGREMAAFAERGARILS